MNRADAVWAVGSRDDAAGSSSSSRRCAATASTACRARAACVLALNHFGWIDPPVFGALLPRTIHYMAKVEAHRVPGLGQLIRSFGAFSVRRGESDREAVRYMRQVVRDGNALGLFVEGTRQRSGEPGEVQPGAAMTAIQEDVPVVPAAIHGSQCWKPGNWDAVSVAWGEPFRFEGLPKERQGATARARPSCSGASACCGSGSSRSTSSAVRAHATPPA